MANGSGYALSQIGAYGLALLLDEDPDELPFVQQDRALAELIGSYVTYKGTMKLPIQRIGDFLASGTIDKNNSNIVPLVPENIEWKIKTFYTLSAGVKQPVEFRVQEERIDLIYKRCLLRKTGNIDSSP